MSLSHPDECGCGEAGSGWNAGSDSALVPIARAVSAESTPPGQTWTAQAGLLIGRELGPFHLDLFTSTDILSEHDGYDASLKLAWPIASGAQAPPTASPGYRWRTTQPVRRSVSTADSCSITGIGAMPTIASSSADVPFSNAGARSRAACRSAGETP